MPNLLDLMSPEHKKQAIEAHKKRMRGDNSYRSAAVSPEAFLVAEAGIFFGWGAIEAIKRGYVAAEHDDGTTLKIPLTMEELSAIVTAARKIKYSELLNQARGTQVATGSVLSKHPKQAFDRGMKPIKDKIKE